GTHPEPELDVGKDGQEKPPHFSTARGTSSGRSPVKNVMRLRLAITGREMTADRRETASPDLFWGETWQQHGEACDGVAADHGLYAGTGGRIVGRARAA